MVLRSLFLAVLLTGCLNKLPPQRLETRAPIAVAMVIDDGVAAPEQFKKRLYDVFESRNLEVREVPVEALGGQRLSAERFSALKAAAGDAPFSMLVEARTQFFTQINGRFRWTVSVKFTVAKAGNSVPTQDASDFPALLQFEHERGQDALDNVGDFVATRLAPLVDGLLASQPFAPPSGAPPLDAGVTLGPADTIYFVMVDRFADGDRSNDGDANGADPVAFHGGDLQGLRDRIDVLEDLGVGTVWLSPVFQMRTTPFNGYGAFHGYWVEDLRQVEPRFGNEGQLRALGQELNAHGMALMLDLVLNHVGPGTALTRTKPEWFHGKGGIKNWSDPTELVMNDVQGLPDLAEERDDVYAYLREASLKWVRVVHPAGFRLDAVKHMPPSFWARFNADMRREAGSSFRLLGEMLDGDPAAVAAAWREGGFTAMFDFPLRFAMVDVFCKGQSPARLGAVLTEDRRYPDPSQLVTLLDNHDLPRIATECEGHAAAAAQFMYATRGVPSLSWGTEAGFTGTREPETRASMDFERKHPMKAVLQAAALLRRQHESLRVGVPVIVAASADALTVKRVAAHERAFVEVRDREVRVSFEAGNFASEVEAARRQWLKGDRTRRVELIGPAGSVVVGSGPELGAWKLENGLPLPAATFLPVGGVFEMKVVSKGKWEQGANRVLFVADEAGPLKVDLAGKGS